tara:strand:+ start:326 stop:901 length:576 start_codon:yes stop_codon:yes gene_type:complete
MLSLFEIALVAIIILALYLQPYVLSEFSQSTIGKIIFIIFIVLLASRSITTGFLGALLLIILLENPSYYSIREGLENINNYTHGSEDNDVDVSISQVAKKDWVVENLCKKLNDVETAICPTAIKDGECIPPEKYTTVFKGIDFADTSNKNGCDICDPACKWSVIDSQITDDTKINMNDQLQNEETLRRGES